MERAEDLFPEAGTPIVLPPEIRCGSLSACGNDGATERPWILLPDVCTTALLIASAPTNDINAHASQLVVVWFQDDFGSPIDSRTHEQLRGIDWARCASDVML